MGCLRSEDFTVKETKKTIVAAVLPVQEHWLPQSNLDLILPPIDVGVFFCYENPNLSFHSLVSTLKKSLAQCLVSYYPFAGEVVESPVGEPEVLCNNRGVEFTEAYAEVELRRLNLYNPDESVEGKLVPKKKRGIVLAAQATELRCGGVVVAITFDHRVADAYSANMFLVSWAEMARAEAVSARPSFRRSVIAPRRPPRYDVRMDDLYVPISAVTPSGASEHTLVSRMYYVAAESLAQLQASASSGESKRTKLESFSAFLWKMVARSSCQDGCTDNKLLTKMGIVVDGRTRLIGDDASSYFGNVLSIPYAEHGVNTVSSQPLPWIADQVHRCIKSGVTKEHFMDLVDWVEAHRPEASLAKIYCAGSSDGPAIVVSSGQRFPVGKMDFGWGRPRVGSYHFPWGGDAGYVMPMPNPAGNGDWIVYMHLRKRQLEVIEKEAGQVFKPLTNEYLDSLAAAAAPPTV
uniref:Uncharacterized protein n=1 Tax=Kalanchoe fedtschenkoi TaxID=63787 RepID=A0A7N0TBF1_KALFE